MVRGNSRQQHNKTDPESKKGIMTHLENISELPLTKRNRIRLEATQLHFTRLSFPAQTWRMADEDLEAIRAQRLAQLQANYGGGGQGADEKEEKAKQIKEMKNSILSQVLDQQARARLNTIAVAKPEKAQMVENMLCQMAQTGQIPSKIGEQQLKELLEKVSEQTQKKTTVKFKRRGLDDSDDEY